MVSRRDRSGLTRRTSIEVDTTGLQPRTVATLFDRGQPVWRLEVLGTLVSRSSKAVGGSAASFQMVGNQSCQSGSPIRAASEKVATLISRMVKEHHMAVEVCRVLPSDLYNPIVETRFATWTFIPIF